MKSIREADLIQAIVEAEKNTSGEIRIHLSKRFFESNLIANAQKKFEELKMHLTDEKNGVLLYFNIRKRKFVLWGDEGIHQKVQQDFWNKLASEITHAIHTKDLTDGIIHAVSKIGAALSEHFPHKTDDKNELPNDISK